MELSPAELSVQRRRLHIELPTRPQAASRHETTPSRPALPVRRRRPVEDVEPSSEEEGEAAPLPPERRRCLVAERVIGSPITIASDTTTLDRPVPAAAAEEEPVDVIGLLEGARLPDSSVSGDLEAPSANSEGPVNPPPVLESISRNGTSVFSPTVEDPPSPPEITFGDASISSELADLFSARAGADATFRSSFASDLLRPSGLEGMFDGSPLSWGPVVNASTPLSVGMRSPPPPEPVPSAVALPASPCCSSSTWECVILSPPSPFRDDFRPRYEDISVPDDPDAVVDDPTPVLDEPDLESSSQEIAVARPEIRWLPANLGRRFVE